jgi:hypothetical protein
MTVTPRHARGSSDLSTWRWIRRQLAGTAPKMVTRVMSGHAHGGVLPVRWARERDYDRVAALVAERVLPSSCRISSKRWSRCRREWAMGVDARRPSPG